MIFVVFGGMTGSSSKVPFKRGDMLVPRKVQCTVVPWVFYSMILFTFFPIFFFERKDHILPGSLTYALKNDGYKTTFPLGW